jgi:hypothetical protein
MIKKNQKNLVLTENVKHLYSDCLPPSLYGSSSKTAFWETVIVKDVRSHLPASQELFEKITLEFIQYSNEIPLQVKGRQIP